MLAANTDRRAEVILDVGGEGRHFGAWNLNPSPVRTIGKNRGEPIPHHIFGRGDDLPFADCSVDRVICERAPLPVGALQEIARVISPVGVITLRHARCPHCDPHAVAVRILPGRVSQRITRIGGQVVQETEFRQAGIAPAATEHEKCAR